MNQFNVVAVAAAAYLPYFCQMAIRPAKHRSLYFLILIAVFTVTRLSAQHRVGDSLAEVIKNSKSDTNLVKTYILLANEQAGADGEKAIKTTNEAISLADKLQFSSGSLKARRTKGILLRKMGKLDESVLVLKDALAITEKMKNPLQIADVYNSLGETYRMMPDYANALVCYQKTVGLTERSKDSSLLAMAINNQGIVYYAQNEFEKAMELYKKALAIRLQLKRPEQIASSYQNIGNCYGRLNNNAAALEYHLKALKIREENNITSSFGMSYLNLGVLYSRMNDHSTALGFYRKASNYLQGSVVNSSNLHLKIGQSYVHLGRLKEAETELTEAYNLAIKSHSKEQLLYTYEVLALLYAAKKDYKKAYEYSGNVNSYKDTVYNEERNKIVNDLQIKYETGKKESEIALLSERNRNQDLEMEKKKEQLSKNRIILFISLGAIVIVLFSFVLLFRQYKEKKKDNLLIKQQKEEMRLQKEIVEVKQKETMDSIRYAQRIQHALQANEQYISRNLTRLKKKSQG